MSWTDKKSIEVINYLKRKYKISTFVETGTYRGINARLHSNNFNYVLTCENDDISYKIAVDNLKHYDNVIIENLDSPKFLNKLALSQYIFYLDAHFYNPKLKKKDRFVVVKELDNMRKFKDSVIIVHDFDNGLGHITYDGIKLDLDLIRQKLKAINKNFYFYTNTLDSCDIVTPNAQDIIYAGLEVDFDTLDNLNYAWTTPRLTYRGILYVLPTKLTNKEMNTLGLRTWN